MFINSLLSCFILLTSGIDSQCIASDQNEKTQNIQRESDEYIPTVIYFNSQELAMLSGLKEIVNIDFIKEEEPVVQTFIIKR